jgi:hypothetical protein
MADFLGVWRPSETYFSTVNLLRRRDNNLLAE